MGVMGEGMGDELIRVELYGKERGDEMGELKREEAHGGEESRGIELNEFLDRDKFDDIETQEEDCEVAFLVNLLLFCN